MKTNQVQLTNEQLEQAIQCGYILRKHVEAEAKYASKASQPKARKVRVVRIKEKRAKPEAKLCYTEFRRGGSVEVKRYPERVCHLNGKSEALPIGIRFHGRMSRPQDLGNAQIQGMWF